jgi:hypothetical protein
MKNNDLGLLRLMSSPRKEQVQAEMDVAFHILVCLVTALREEVENLEELLNCLLYGEAYGDLIERK